MEPTTSRPVNWRYIWSVTGWAVLFILLAIGVLFAAHGVLWLAGPH